MDSEVGSNLQTLVIASSRMGSKSGHVQEVFENTSHYLKRQQVDIRFRIETVRRFAALVDWHRLLDIGCGDGSISLQLLTPSSHLTLLDLSANMVGLAEKNVPEEFSRNVIVRNENFSSASFDSAPFDLVITVGVLAHVDSPDAFLAKIRTLLPPGGSLIIEFTDAEHFVGRLGRVWGRLKEVFAPARYPTNKLSYTKVASLFEKNKFKLVSVFRYARIPLPGIDRIMSPDTQYKIAKRIFGEYSTNRNVALGNEYICLLTAD
jgi:cyclopropane fatty-acyl-phospholipid synthase-like methyltransferase